MLSPSVEFSPSFVAGFFHEVLIVFIPYVSSPVEM